MFLLYLANYGTTAATLQCLQPQRADTRQNRAGEMLPGKGRLGRYG